MIDSWDSATFRIVASGCARIPGVIPGIILAAGASSRMGRPKALLPLPDGELFLLRIAGTLRRAGLDRVIAVVGTDEAAIRAAVHPRGEPGLRLVANPAPARGQLSSLVVGLDALAPDDDAVLVTIVDLPLVSVDTVRRVIAGWRPTRAPIARPAHENRHGHPVVFAAELFEELRRADPALGARAVLERHRPRIVDVPIDDPGAYDDIDTPEDYRRIIGDPGA